MSSDFALISLVVRFLVVRFRVVAAAVAVRSRLCVVAQGRASE